jgi:hypothetical protein
MQGPISDREFLEAKLITARYYAARNFPDAAALRAKLEAGSESADGAAGGGVLSFASRHGSSDRLQWGLRLAER